MGPVLGRSVCHPQLRLATELARKRTSILQLTLKITRFKTAKGFRLPEETCTVYCILLV